MPRSFHATDVAVRGRDLQLDPEVIAALRSELPSVAARTVAAVTSEVPQYAEGLSDQMAEGITAGVRMALAAFLRLVSSGGREPSAALEAATEGAYDLGRTEARAGRTIDALLSAYRVGTRTAWRELAGTAVASGVPASTVADFAGLVFAYIDELSAASVAGHTDQLSSTARIRARHLHELAHSLVTGAPPDVVAARADRAAWRPPTTLTAVLLPAARLHEGASLLDPRTLALSDDRAGGPIPPDTGVLLVPDVARTRSTLLRTLHGLHAVVGPAQPWTQVAASVDRAARALDLDAPADGAPLDTETQLTPLVLRADPVALADLREQVLAPLADLRGATADRLTETLRSWLLHLGRRNAVAADLGIHPQTVRYRMNQIRERYGDRLDHPDEVLRLTVALALEVDRQVTR